MATVSLTGSDSIVINNRPLQDLADDSVAELTFPNDIATVKTGKNGNAIFALNESGNQADFSIRLIRGSADDKFMQGLLALQQNNFAAFPLMIGNFIKKVGDGDGNITSDNYVCSGGVFGKLVEAKSNVAGESDQSVSIYKLKFSKAARAIT